MWTGYVARMGEMRNVYKILVAKPEGKQPLGRSRHRWEDNIKTESEGGRVEDVDWMHLAWDRDH